MRDVARIDIEAQDNSSISYFDSKPSVALGIFQLPGSNALATGQAIEASIKEISKGFPAGVAYSTAYNPTQFIAQSVEAVEHTIIEAIILVVIVVVLFLQTWRAAIIPILAIPVSLIGAFFVMSLFGFSLNNLSLFGLVLAIGIVVDDAIVVVESVEHNISTGLSPRDAAYKTMDEVGGALVAISLVLASVFIPSAFITGISGEFYRQFALTIAGSTLISLLVSLTLSPAMCALLLKPHDKHGKTPWYARPVTGFFRLFNKGFDGVSRGYGWLTGRLVRFAVIVLVVYVGILAYGFTVFRDTPEGFIPAQDRGYLIVASQLPGGAALQRTNEVMTRAAKIALKIPGIEHVVNIVGFSGATFTNAPNAGAMFVILGPAEERAKDPRQSAGAIQGALFQQLAGIEEAFMIVVQPPPVSGIGNAGGFRMMIEDRGGRGFDALQGAVYAMMGRANQTPGLTQVFSLFETSTPQLFLDIDRTKAQMLGVNMADVFAALQIYIGSSYVNDFNLFGRTYRVQAQADAPYRLTPEDVLKLRAKNSNGDTVPFGSFTTVRDISGPFRVPRYNLYPAAELDGNTAPGTSQGQAIQMMEQIARETLPEGFAFEWTTLAYQQINAGNTAIFAFALGVVFVFLVLAAQYESLTLPLAVILIVPMCLDRGRHRHPDTRDGHQHPQSGRLHRADRSRGQERHPDRGVRQAARGSRRTAAAGGNARRPAPSAADHHDLARLHLRRGAAGAGDRGGRRTAPGARHRGVLRHDRRDACSASCSRRPSMWCAAGWPVSASAVGRHRTSSRRRLRRAAAVGVRGGSRMLTFSLPVGRGQG